MPEPAECRGEFFGGVAFLVQFCLEFVGAVGSAGEEGKGCSERGGAVLFCGGSGLLAVVAGIGRFGELAGLVRVVHAGAFRVSVPGLQ